MQELDGREEKEWKTGGKLGGSRVSHLNLCEVTPSYCMRDNAHVCHAIIQTVELLDWAVHRWETLLAGFLIRPVIKCIILSIDIKWVLIHDVTVANDDQYIETLTENGSNPFSNFSLSVVGGCYTFGIMYKGYYIFYA